MFNFLKRKKRSVGSMEDLEFLVSKVVGIDCHSFREKIVNHIMYGDIYKLQSQRKALPVTLDIYVNPRYKGVIFYLQHIVAENGYTSSFYRKNDERLGYLKCVCIEPADKVKAKFKKEVIDNFTKDLKEAKNNGL